MSIDSLSAGTPSSSKTSAALSLQSAIPNLISAIVLPASPPMVSRFGTCAPPPLVQAASGALANDVQGSHAPRAGATHEYEGDMRPRRCKRRASFDME